jgi:hypothetical protein
MQTIVANAPKSDTQRSVQEDDDDTTQIPTRDDAFPTAPHPWPRSDRNRLPSGPARGASVVWCIYVLLNRAGKYAGRYEPGLLCKPQCTLWPSS